MSVQVEIDTSDLERYVRNIEAKFGSLGELLRQFLDDRAVPALEAEAGSQRNVVTGTYSGSWLTDVEDEFTAIVTTDAFYWVFLEYGTHRGIKPKPVVMEVVRAMIGDLGPFIVDALDLSVGA